MKFKHSPVLELWHSAQNRNQFIPSESGTLYTKYISPQTAKRYHCWLSTVWNE